MIMKVIFCFLVLVFGPLQLTAQIPLYQLEDAPSKNHVIQQAVDSIGAAWIHKDSLGLTIDTIIGQSLELSPGFSLFRVYRVTVYFSDGSTLFWDDPFLYSITDIDVDTVNNTFTQTQTLNFDTTLNETFALDFSFTNELDTMFNYDGSNLVDGGTVLTDTALIRTVVSDSLSTVNVTETDPIYSAWDKDYNDLINTPTIPSAIWSLNGSEAYYTNNVGIGTTNPDARLHVEGEIFGDPENVSSFGSRPRLIDVVRRSTSTAEDFFPTIVVRNRSRWTGGAGGNASMADIGFFADDGVLKGFFRADARGDYFDGPGFGIAGITNHDFHITTNNVGRFIIKNTGEIGINDFTPSAALDINGDLRVSDRTGGAAVSSAFFDSNGQLIEGTLDLDTDPNNEIQSWSTLGGIPADIADGDDDTQLTTEEVQDAAFNTVVQSPIVYDDAANQVEIDLQTITTDAIPEGDEFILVQDPSSSYSNEKITVQSIWDNVGGSTLTEEQVEDFAFNGIVASDGLTYDDVSNNISLSYSGLTSDAIDGDDLISRHDVSQSRLEESTITELLDYIQLNTVYGIGRRTSTSNLSVPSSGEVAVPFTSTSFGQGSVAFTYTNSLNNGSSATRYYRCTLLLEVDGDDGAEFDVILRPHNSSLTNYEIFECVKNGTGNESFNLTTEIELEFNESVRAMVVNTGSSGTNIDWVNDFSHITLSEIAIKE